VAGSRDGHVQLAVDELAFALDGGRQDAEQARRADDGGEDDDVALTALVALHGVDGDVLGIGDAQGLHLLADGGYLAAEGDDDAQRRGGLPGNGAGLVQPVQSLYEQGHDAGFGLVYLWVRSVLALYVDG